MKEKKLIRYRLGVSRYFPMTHPQKGLSTYFKEKIQTAVSDDYDPCAGCFDADPCSVCGWPEILKEIWPKLHTIRANYCLWEKRFKKILSGDAVIDLFYWSDKPYRSKQIVFTTLSKEDGIGIQKIEFLPDGDGCRSLGWPSIDEDWHQSPSGPIVAKNDGLSFEDWLSWFRSYDLSEPMAIIHFTKFRY